MTLKRLIVSLCIVFICSITFIGGYTRSANIVYADDTTDEWMNVTTNEQLVEAFRYYCKSRDVTINGGAADAVTHFTTKTFNGLCNTLGIDATALQAHLKYQTDGNLGLRYLFDTEGISLYNRIFAQFLQDNDLEVGDQDINKEVEGGVWFSDADGYGCYCFVDNNVYAYQQNWTRGQLEPNGVSAKGTVYRNVDGYTLWQKYRYQESGLKETFTIHFKNNTSYNINIYRLTSTYQNYYLDICINSQSNGYNCIVNGANFYYGYMGVCYRPKLNENDTRYGYWIVAYRQNNAQTDYIQFIHQIDNVEQPTNGNVYIVSTVINNNIYEGDTIINNNGTTGDDEPVTPPGPDDPSYNPYPDGGGGTTPPTNTGGGSGEDDGTITFPDFDFHLPEINWSLGDLSEKFPFSIPFDLIAFFTVLNAEPQAPAIDADIPLGSWYTWHFEADFSQFDNYAVIIRNVEFIGFCVGLIYLTIKLVKG